MPITIYPEEGDVLNRPPQPSVFDCGNPLTVAEKICNVDKDSVKSVNGIEPDSNGNVEIETGGGGEGTVKSVNDVQPDESGNVQLTAADVGAATTADIPNKLPNPQSLSLMAGKSTVLYDGSIARSLSITPGGIGAATAAQGNKADTSVQSVNGVKPDSSGNVEVGAGEGTVKSVNNVQPDDNGNVQLTAADVGAATVAQVLERMMPVGSIVEWAPVDGGDTDLSTPEKVAAYYGFGTWEVYGPGRMLLGASDSHAVGGTGGLEEHTHRYGVRVFAYFGSAAGGDGQIIEAKDYPTNTWHSTGNFEESNIVHNAAAATYTELDNSQHIEAEADTSSESNLPPYITIYRWRRIA